MRLSLSVAAQEGTCSKCEEGPVLVIPFVVITETHSGEASALCAGCLFDMNGVTAEVPMQELAPGRKRHRLKKAKKRSLQQEVDVMAELGGHTQPGSGNQAGAKGDGRKKVWARQEGETGLRVETKYTEANSFSVPLDDLYKISGEAAHGEIPLYIIDFLEPGKRSLKDRFAVVHFEDLKGLLNASRNNR